MRVTFMFHLIHLTHLSLTFLWMMISKYTTHTLRSQLPHRLLLVNKVLTVFNILSAFIRSFLKLAGALQTPAERLRHAKLFICHLFISVRSINNLRDQYDSVNHLLLTN